MRASPLLLAWLSAGSLACTADSSDRGCEFFPLETVDATDSRLGFSALDVIDHLGTRELNATFDDAYLAPFEWATVSWTLGEDDDVILGIQSTDSAHCDEGPEGLQLYVVVELQSDDGAVVVSGGDNMFATGLDDSELTWRVGMANPHGGQGTALVPDELMDYAVEQAGGVLDNPVPGVVVGGNSVVEPYVNLSYQGDTPEGPAVVTVFIAQLTPR